MRNCAHAFGSDPDSGDGNDTVLDVPGDGARGVDSWLRGPAGHGKQVSGRAETGWTPLARRKASAIAGTSIVM